MGLQEKETELFNRWEPECSGFITDGAVDPEEYANSDPKLLFLLKEANDPDNTKWCLREFMRDGARSQTFTTMTRWIQGIRSLPAELPWSLVSKTGGSKEERASILKSVAAMNLKKAPGGHTMDPLTFWPAVKKDARYIQEQFDLYDADLVICCGPAVAQAFRNCMRPSDGAGWLLTSRGIKYLEYSARKFVISYSHPEARVPDNLLYYGIVDAVREIRNSA